MRIGMSSGGGFGGTLNYDLDKDGRNDKDVEILHAEGVETVQQAVKQLGQERVDQIVSQAMVADWKAVLKDLGYDNTQFVIVRHSEKSNPHSHCVLNMVDNDGRRLKDHGEMRKGVAACRELTIQRGYCWGEHKSMSQCRSERPYERERQSMCRDIYRLHASGLRPFPACLGTSGIRGGRGVASRESGSRVY